MFKKRKGEGEVVGIIAVIAIVVAAITLNPVYFVQSGEKAVVKSLGVVKQEVINEGMHFRTPFIDSVINVDVKPWTINEEALAYTKDNQPIDVKFNVIATYPLDDIANTVITYNSQPYANFAQSKIMDTFKAVAGKYTASEFVTNREKIRKEVVEAAKLAVVNDQTKKPAIKVIDIPITNVDFDDQYETAIKEKQVAQQNAQKAEYVLQQARVDAQSSIAKAEGEARALTIKAQAIAKSPSVLRLNEIDKWDGHYPLGAKVIGGGATIVDAKE